MGLFDKLLGKAGVVSEKIMDAEPGAVYAPISGTYIALEQIPEEVFAQGILGPGCGIEVAEGLVVSPVNGKILSVADTSHAIGIASEEGAEFLIHVGMDTVEMNGDGFQVLIKEGEAVMCGQPVMKFDIDKIKAAGHPTTTAFVLTNADAFKEFMVETGKSFSARDKVGIINK